MSAAGLTDTSAAIEEAFVTKLKVTVEALACKLVMVSLHE